MKRLPSDTPQDRARPLGDHLLEIRRRLWWSLGSFVVLLIPAWSLSAGLIHQMSRVTGPLVFLGPTEAFAARLKLSAVVALALGAPIFIYHIWRFVGVALTVSERRIFIGALPFSYLLLVLGTAFGWFVIVPTGLRFLMGFASADLRPNLSVQACVSFALWTSLGLGLLFQLPVAVGALARWGWVRAATLSRYRRHAAIAILVAAALLTPGPDVFSQLLLALPTYLLFEISVALARFLEP